jgi:multiple sugar transport system substrate-binding protein
MPWRRKAAIPSLLLLGGALAAAGCGSSGNSQSSANSKSITVAVAFPSPPASALARFMKQTGISVHWVNVGWDDLQTKIAAAAAAHTYFADVTDVDWSKVGEYYGLKWFYPLNPYFSVSTLQGQDPQLSSFIDHGQLMGVPMDASFLVTTINTKEFHKAGITTTPTTIAQYTADLRQLQKTHVSPHPLDIPLQAQEGLSTYWYELTGAFGGHVLTSSYQPTFTSPSSPGYKALNWIVSAYKTGLVPPGNINGADVASITGEQAHGQTASAFSEYSGDVATVYDVKADSSVVGQVQYIPTPGLSGPGPNLSEPDGVGIPKTAANVKGAVKFIKWLDSTQNQALWAGADGGKDVIVGFPLPNSTASMNTLTASVKGEGVSELSALLKTSGPVFPGGAPPWYPLFSNAVFTNIHSAAAGQESVQAAISAIAQVAAAHAK